MQSRRPAPSLSQFPAPVPSFPTRAAPGGRSLAQSLGKTTPRGRLLTPSRQPTRQIRVLPSREGAVVKKPCGSWRIRWPRWVPAGHRCPFCLFLQVFAPTARLARQGLSTGVATAPGLRVLGVSLSPHPVPSGCPPPGHLPVGSGCCRDQASGTHAPGAARWGWGRPHFVPGDPPQLPPFTPQPSESFPAPCSEAAKVSRACISPGRDPPALRAGVPWDPNP